ALGGRYPRRGIGARGAAVGDAARFGGADRVQHLRAGGARAGDDVDRGGAPVRRHLPAARVRIVLGADAGEQHVERRHAELQAERAIAVVGEEPVVARLQRQAGGDADGLVSGAADLEEDLALVLELNFLVVEAPRQQHAAVDGEELVAIETVEDLRFAPVENRFHPKPDYNTRL